ncbi:SAVED domain-containing protein [Microbacterium flavescens]|uniref:SAVED domain-containing protein n=1 Tax=Microbacterium flavescens TaxID=69366 RepID=UPI001BDE7C90|nr:SAVED domain-containing protein [Microbacterium flavescens]BFF11823.1 hypothetical protein GCM10025699_31260 [Microbacterium flavescens]
MTEMPSATGVRIAGDEYQWLVGWRACLQVLHEHATGYSGNRLVAVGVEARGAGNADDVVLYRASPPHTFMQVKYAVDASSPLNLEYLTADRILAKLVESHQTLSAENSVAEIRLVTNRQIDPGDVLLRDRDGRDGRLVPRALQGTPNSRRGEARTAWAHAAGVDVDALEKFLDDFHIESGRDATQLRSEVQLLMTANGLDSDERAVEIGLSWVQSVVVAGERRIELDAIVRAVDRMGLTTSEPWTTLSVATVDHDPAAGDSSASIDRVDRMQGDTVWNRIRPCAPYTWDDLAFDIRDVVKSLQPGRVLVTGFMRQAVGFLVGTEMRSVRGFVVATKQRSQLWTSDASAGSALLTYEEVPVGRGDDLGVIVQVSYPGSRDAIDWILASELPVASILIISTPVIGANSITSAASASSIATQIRNQVRSGLAGVGRIHLFQIGPLGLSVLLGHHWSRMRPTTVYEHIDGAEYEEAFQIEA